MARVNDDATVASVLSSLGKTCSTFLGRSSAGAPFFKGPELCTYYDGASPAGIDCSDTTNPGHEALCYCKTSLIQIEEDEHVADDSSSEEDGPPDGFQLVQVSADSSQMDAAVFSKIVRFEASCANPQACYDIYLFGGCVAPGALGAATDRVYWGVVTPDNDRPTVRWREQDPSPVPLAGHSVVVADPTYAIVLGGQSSCSEDATYLDLTFLWRRADAGWVSLPAIPEPCGLSFHTANYFNDAGNVGMVVLGGRRGTSGSACSDPTAPRVSNKAWWFDLNRYVWTRKKTQGWLGVWGHASAVMDLTAAGPANRLFVHGGRTEDGSINRVLLYSPLDGISTPGTPLLLETLSRTGVERMFHTMLPFRTSSLKLAGGARASEDVWKPDNVYNNTWTAYAAKQIQTGVVQYNGAFRYPVATGVWGQAAAQQQLKGPF
ncbi:unnamed protein product [Durusdinium trenchii]|uniref:Uncharacterized protein n=1 Tax=Durusdinium trenchii TaxID=1381693 RepID=A0ABP0HNL7_9DINO